VDGMGWAQPSHTGKTEKIMNKTTNKTTTHKDSLVRADLPLEDHELDSVSGGSPSKQGAQGGQNMFQQILQQVMQQQGGEG
jgi:hypothetical protein